MSSNGEKKLPSGWTETQLGELLTVLRGVSYKKQDATTEPAPGKIPILRATNIDAGLNFDDLVYVPQEYVSEVQLLNLGDIVIAASSGSRHVVGKAAALTVPWVGSFGAFCYGLRPYLWETASYISLFLQTSTYRDYVSALSAGVNINNLRRGHIEGTPLPIPPLNEQHRIVAKIEGLFSELDKGIESLKTAQAQLKVYRQAVLKHTFEGKLTAQWRGEHLEAKPASELLQRILVERRRGWEENQLRKFAEKGKAPSKNWKAKYKEPATADTTDLPLLPDSWCWSSIDQLIREPLRNGHSAVASQTDGGIPTFSISAVTDGDFSAKNIKMTSADPLKVQDLWIKSDDIFVQRSNTPELVGTARRYRGENGRAIFPDLLIRIRVTSSVLSAFVELALQSVRCHAYFRHKSQGISGSMPKIDQDVVRLAAIPLPPLPEQEAIIEAVEGQLTVIDHIEAEIDGQLLKADSLRQSILKRAFAGELVPQDPHDEPVSVLLDRIRTEREKAVKNNHPKKTKRKKAAA